MCCLYLHSYSLQYGLMNASWRFSSHFCHGFEHGTISLSHTPAELLYFISFHFQFQSMRILFSLFPLMLDTVHDSFIFTLLYLHLFFILRFLFGFPLGFVFSYKLVVFLCLSLFCLLCFAFHYADKMNLTVLFVLSLNY